MTDTSSSSPATLFYQHATSRRGPARASNSGAPTRRRQYYDEARTYNLYCEVCERVTEHTLAIASRWEYYTCTQCPTTLAYKVK